MMENVYFNTRPIKPAPNASRKILEGSNNSKKSTCLWVIIIIIIILVLIIAVLVAGFVYLYLRHSSLAADLSTKLSSMTEERDWLNAALANKTEELKRLKQNETCPLGWKKFKYSCYILSGCGSWDDAKEECRNLGGDLVVIDSADEQTFLVAYTKKSFWIGLNDKENEGSWKWIDGTSPALTFWVEKQPDNGGKDYGAKEEDCAHIRTGEGWNDLPCSYCLNWICEKANHFTV
ncbi:CD209 antigen-like protein C [Cyprinodon tularosa]|uniref:CD209 antigen-like protein C n=1 Tax=Cyprinodon tularosa TaxID=77115 RepID=UPI0018E20570|nr:CD209 antigen-like protein C [Cyprinodon tularosa]